MFRGFTSMAARIDRSFYLPRNAEIENGLQMAEVTLCFSSRDAEQPHRAIIGYYGTKIYQGGEIKEYQRLQEQIAKGQEKLKPGNMIPLLEKQKELIRSMGGNYQDQINRIDGEIAAYRKQAAEFAKEQRTQAGKIALEKEKAKLKTGDYKPTSLMQNIPFVAKRLGVSEKTATEILTKSKAKSDDELISYFTGVFLREDSEITGEELTTKIKTAMDTIRELRGEKPEETTIAPSKLDWKKYAPQAQ